MQVRPDRNAAVEAPPAPSFVESIRASRAALGGLALGAYLFAALLIFGRGVVASPGAKVVGDAGADKTIFMWAFRWWPHALAAGHDPFDANVVWVPHGIDLSWTTSVPLLSLVLTPLTAAAGSIAAYNVAVLAAPVLSAWTTYLLARYVTGAFWPSLVAGWLFGFSAFEIGHMIGHLNLVFLPFVPLCALLALEHLNGEVTSRRFVVLLALALTAQFLTSTEIFLDTLVVGALFLAAAALLVPALRDRLRATSVYAAAAGALSLVLVSPYLWHAFVVSGPGNAPRRSPYSESADVLNYVVPTRLIWLQLPGSSRIAGHFTATGAERGAYLGVPLLAVVVVFLWRRWRSRFVRAVALGLAATVVASLGASVRVAGHGIVPAPWKVLAVLPVTKTLLPIRLTLFVALVVAVIAGVWLAEPGRWRWVLAALAVVFVLPNPASRFWSSHAPNPSFFRTAAYKRQLSPGETALVLPFGGAGWSLYWQAEDGFGYRLVGGHLGREVTPREERWRSIYLALGKGPSPSSLEPRFRAFLRAHRVGVIVVAPDTKPHARRLVNGLGIKPIHAAEVLVYRLHAT